MHRSPAPKIGRYWSGGRTRRGSATCAAVPTRRHSRRASTSNSCGRTKRMSKLRRSPVRSLAHSWLFFLTASTGSRTVRFIYHRPELRWNDDGDEQEVTSLDSSFVVYPPSYEQRTTVSRVFVHRRHARGSRPVWTCSKDSTKSSLCGHINQVRNFLREDERTKGVFPIDDDADSPPRGAGTYATSVTTSGHWI